MRRKVIRLDKHTKKRIVELLAVRDDLLQIRRGRLDSIAVVFYGLAVGSGFVFLMSIIKTGELFVALILTPVIVGSLYVARKLEKAKAKNLVKIKLR